MAEKGGLLPVEDARARILAALTPTAAETLSLPEASGRCR
jgi:molybdopterin biosynthesis enzyme